MKKIFEELIGKKVKVVYDDFGKPQFSRGILQKVEEDFIIVDGDISKQIIRIDKILKINHIKDEK